MSGLDMGKRGFSGELFMKADKEKVTRLLKTARGQMDGLLKMVEEDRYCIDISNQLMATQAILRNVNREVLHAHLGSCVIEAFEKGDAQKKIEEIMDIIDKLSK
jgi:CsoR family transcriptional regulator, copper-sensing transcriptional repressor